MEIVPIDFRDAKAFVRDWHRHSDEPQGHKFSTSVRDERGALRGVGIAGRPICKAHQDGRTFEITRVATDGAPNACSMIYGALTRAAKALGFRRGITYTRFDEPGTSLKAAGWRKVAFVKAEQWDRPSRRRKSTREAVPRWRWQWP